MKILWTDGSASPNPGPGGFAVLEEKAGGDFEVIALGNAKETTNIRMEGLAMITAIEYAKDEGCEIHSDSQFWINVLTEWAPEWKKRNWIKKGGIKNLDIVQKLYKLYQTYPVKLVFVYGHAGTRLNELADEYANKAREHGLNELHEAENREIKIQGKYRHFEGGEYRVLAIAKHTETDEKLVIYQALYGEGGIFARPYAMFASKVDREKYPDAKQEYRFELIEE